MINNKFFLKVIFVLINLVVFSGEVYSYTGVFQVGGQDFNTPVQVQEGSSRTLQLIISGLDEVENKAINACSFNIMTLLNDQQTAVVDRDYSTSVINSGDDSSVFNITYNTINDGEVEATETILPLVSLTVSSGDRLVPGTDCSNFNITSGTVLCRCDNILDNQTISANSQIEILDESANLDIDFETTQTMINETDPETQVAEVSFQLPYNVAASDTCQAIATIDVDAARSAVNGVHYNFQPLEVSFDSGNSKIEPILLTPINTGPGDGDQTVVLTADFELINRFGGELPDSCRLSGDTSQEVSVIIKDSPLPELEVSLDRTQAMVNEDEPAEKVAEVIFELPAGLQTDGLCQAVATVNAVGGNAVNGRHFDFTTQTISFGASDSSPKVVPVVLDVRNTGPGDGDHTVILQADFNLVNTLNTGVDSSLYCQLSQPSSIQQTILIKDSATTSLSGDLRPVREVVSAGSGIQTVADLELKLAGSARPDAYCNAEAFVRVIAGGTAVEGEHFRFAATAPTLRYGEGSANFAKLPIELDVLPGTPGQGDKTVVLEARFLSNGVNQGDGLRNSCPLSGRLTERHTVTITGSPANDVQTTLTPVSNGEFLEGLGDTTVAEVGFELLSGSRPDENCRVVANITADTARSTAIEGEHFRIITAQVTFGSGDNTTKIEPVVVELLDDNNPDNDSRELYLLSQFVAEDDSCAVTAAEQVARIIIKNDPEANLQAQLSAESYAVVEGSQIQISLSFQEEAMVSDDFAQRTTQACEVAAEWTVEGLQPADYRFDAPDTIRYSPGISEFAYTLTLNEDRQREGVESFDISVQLSPGANDPCPLAASLINTTVNLPNRIVLNDGIESLGPDANKPQEPELVLKETCNAIRTYAAVAPVDADNATPEEDRAVLDALNTNIGDAALSATNREILEGRRSYYIDHCWNRGSQSANDLRDRNYEPEEVVSQGTALLNGATRQLSNVRTRLNKLRATNGDRGLDISGINLNIQDAAIPSAVTEGALGGAAGDEIDGLFEETRWGAFVNGEYAFGEKNRGNDQKPQSGDRNFEFNSQGLTVGADYRFPGEKFIAGAALGYKDFDAEFSSEEGGTSNKGYNFSVYGTYLLSEKSYFDAMVSYGRNRIKTVRPVNQVSKDANGQPEFTESGELIIDEAFATGAPDADEISFSVGGGYDFQIEEWTLTPYGRVDYVKGKIEAYEEQSSTEFENAGLYGIDTQELESLSSSVGLKASKVISTSSGVFVPQASLEWRHQFKDRDLISGQTLHLVDDSQLGSDSLGVNSAFLEDNSTNTSIDKDYFNINVGVSAVFPQGRSGFVNLESRLGDDTTDETAVKAGYRWEFF